MSSQSRLFKLASGADLSYDELTTHDSAECPRNSPSFLLVPGMGDLNSVYRHLASSSARRVKAGNFM